MSLVVFEWFMSSCHQLLSADGACGSAACASPEGGAQLLWAMTGMQEIKVERGHARGHGQKNGEALPPSFIVSLCSMYDEFSQQLFPTSMYSS